MPAPCRAKRRPRALRQGSCGRRAPHRPPPVRAPGRPAPPPRASASCRGGATARARLGANDAGGAHQGIDRLQGAVATIDDQHMRRAALQQMAPGVDLRGQRIVVVAAHGNQPHRPRAVHHGHRGLRQQQLETGCEQILGVIGIDARLRHHRHEDQRQVVVGNDFGDRGEGIETAGLPTRIADTGMSSRIACACSITQSVSSGCAGSLLRVSPDPIAVITVSGRQPSAERVNKGALDAAGTCRVGGIEDDHGGTAGFLVGIECRGYHGPARPEAPEGVRKWGKIRRILSAIQRIQTIPMSAPTTRLTCA